MPRLLVLVGLLAAWGCTPAHVSGTSGSSGSFASAGSTSAGATSTGSSSAGATSGSGASSGASSVGSGSTGSSSGGATSSTGGTGSHRPFPDTFATIAILADQLPNLSAQQQQFVVSHYVGTEKQTLNQSQPRRALKPDFLVLHYHLAMWQSAPGVDFIVDGQSWSNDYPTVDTHEDWFWHNADGQRVASVNDGKLLMNVSVPAFQTYWADTIAQQVAAGDYDGVFFDSASPALLNFEAQSPPDPRLAGTGVRDTSFTELGGQTWIHAWEGWITALNDALALHGVPLMPNTGAMITGWDNTNYLLSAGAFVEGFATPNFAESDWAASTNQLLAMSAADKKVILQNYLSGEGDLAARRYYLANYLLVKGHHTYLDYFANGPLEWYPEWSLDLGQPQSSATDVSQLLSGGVYRRDFANGVVLVNPGDADVGVSLGSNLRRVEPQGGGAVDASGAEPGTLGYTSMSSITVPAHGAEILLR